MLTAPVQCNADHAEQTDGHVAVEHDWEYLAERLAQCPLLHRVSDRLQWHADGAEEQVGDAQRDDEGGRGVIAQLWTPDQGQQCD